VISADVFWARFVTVNNYLDARETYTTYNVRYYFKLQRLKMHGPDLNLDGEEDDEELSWDVGEKYAPAEVAAVAPVISVPSTYSAVEPTSDKRAASPPEPTVNYDGKAVVAENQSLRAENALLQARIRELETEVKLLAVALANSEKETAQTRKAKNQCTAPAPSSSETSFVDMVSSSPDIATDTDKDEFVQCSSPQETSSGSDRAVMVDDDSDFPNPRSVTRKKAAASGAAASTGKSKVSPKRAEEDAAAEVSTNKKQTSSLSSESGGRSAAAAPLAGLPDLDEDDEGGWDSTW
jgi:hypothetical protein